MAYDGDDETFPFGNPFLSSSEDFDLSILPVSDSFADFSTVPPPIVAPTTNHHRNCDYVSEGERNAIRQKILANLEQVKVLIKNEKQQQRLNPAFARRCDDDRP